MIFNRRKFQSAWRSLEKHRLQSALSTLGIVFAVVAVVAMLAIAEGGKRETLAQLRQLGARNLIVRSMESGGAPAGGATQIARASAIGPGIESSARGRGRAGLTLGDAFAIARLSPRLVCVAPLRELSASILERASSGAAYEILAVTRDYREAKSLELEQGRFFTPLDEEKRLRVCVLGAQAARELGDRGAPGAIIHIENESYQVIGVLAGWKRIQGRNLPVSGRDYNRCILIPLGSEPSMLGAARVDSASVQEISVQYAPETDMEKAALALRAILLQSRRGPEDFSIMIPEALLRQARKTQGIFNIILGSIAMISMLVGGVGIMNIMLANVTERAREIGVRRAVGATRRNIAEHFLMESVLLTGMGGLIGMAVGVAAAAAIQWFAGWRMALTIWSVLLALAMSCGVGILSGWYPALQAARLDPIEALRRE